MSELTDELHKLMFDHRVIYSKYAEINVTMPDCVIVMSREYFMRLMDSASIFNSMRNLNLMDQTIFGIPYRIDTTLDDGYHYELEVPIVFHTPPMSMEEHDKYLEELKALTVDLRENHKVIYKRNQYTKEELNRIASEIFGDDG